MRVWIAGSDFSTDIHVSAQLLTDSGGHLLSSFAALAFIAHLPATTLRKLRNSAKFMLGNLYDFDPTINNVATDDLLPVDQYLYEFFLHLSQPNFQIGLCQAL